MKKKILTQKAKELRKEYLTQLSSLITSGFGLVAALAWNEVIKTVVNNYIEPLVGGSSGLISLSIYALLVTSLAVLITYNLSRLIKKY